MIVKLKKGVFGLPESPRLWWKRVSEELMKARWKKVSGCPATFMVRDQSNALVGLLTVHVDDGAQCGGGPEYEKTVPKFRQRVTIKEDHGPVFQLLGRRISLGPDSLTVDGFLLCREDHQGWDS